MRGTFLADSLTPSSPTWVVFIRTNMGSSIVGKLIAPPLAETTTARLGITRPRRVLHSTPALRLTLLLYVWVDSVIELLRVD